jgi:hypothetical protein
LKQLTEKCHNFLTTSLTCLDLKGRHVLDQVLSVLSDFICQSAERKSYGLRSKDSILYEDDSEEALYFWEISNTTILPPLI